MRLVTVGSGTVVPDSRRASACHWVETGDTRAVVDCGAGGLQGLATARLPWDRVTHILLSHFHADHIAEIPSLLFALRHALEEPRTAQLEIWGPPGTKALFEAWSSAFGEWIVEPGFPLAIHELPFEGRRETNDLTVTTHPTPHTDESIAFRFAASSGILGYTGDTGPSDSLGAFFQGVDLLLAECSLPDELVGPNHLSPSRIATLANESGVQRLAVTHVYPQLRRLDLPGLIGEAGYTGDIIIVYDGLELDL